MQKKLIVLAIAALASTSAFADSTVTAYGVVDAAIVNVNGTNVASTTQVQSGGLAGSRFGLKGVEDLDNGLKAIAVLEYALSINTNQGTAASTSNTAGTAPATTSSVVSNILARQQLVGLTGGFGTVAAGYLQTAAYDWGGKYDVLGGSSVSALQNVTGTNFLLGMKGNAVRASNAIAYISPEIAGVTVALNYSTSLQNVYVKNVTTYTNSDINLANGTNSVDVTAALVSVAYNAGPLSVDVVYASTGNPAGAAGGTATAGFDQSEYGVGATYDLGVAKLFATYQANTNNAQQTANVANATLTNTAYSVGAAVPVAGDTVAVSYAANTLQTGTTTAVGYSATAYSVGYLHPMSKTTTAYASYSGVTNASGNVGAVSTVDNSALSNVTKDGGSSNMIALGLMKKF